MIRLTHTRRYDVVPCLLFYALLLLAAKRLQAQSYTVINYRWVQGFNASNVYNIFQDSRKYLWISTENGVIRYNGSDFRHYTKKDGLLDNEVLSISEDQLGRVWLLPFTNTLCYYRNGRLYNQSDDPLLKRIKLEARVSQIMMDATANLWIREEGQALLRVDTAGKISRWKPDQQAIQHICIGKEGALHVLCGNAALYVFKNGYFELTGQAPFEPDQFTVLNASAVYSPAQGELWYYAGENSGQRRSLPKITQPTGVTNNEDETVFVGSENGLYLVNLQSGTMMEQLLPGYKTGPCIRTQDGSLWIGTAGKGLIRMVRSPVRSVPFAQPLSAFLYIKATADGMYGTTQNGLFVEAKISADGRYQTNIQRINPERRYEHCVFVKREKGQVWMLAADGIKLKKSIQGKPVKAYYTCCKQALEEADGEMITATNTGVLKFSFRSFMPRDTLLKGQRVVTVSRIGDTLYAGTLSGLVACFPDGHCLPVDTGNRFLRTRITALCKDSSHVLWCADNGGVLLAIVHNKVIDTIGPEEGLQCSRIAALKASRKYLWAGTDNGLFAITRKPPYRIARHVTYTTGLAGNQVNCIDVKGDMIWAGTSEGVSYFDENELPEPYAAARIEISSIRNGDVFLTPGNDVLQLQSASLSVEFDAIDFSGNAQPVFSWRLNEDTSWTTISGRTLSFPSLPYGKFRLAIRAFSPNWHQQYTLVQNFYNKPPYYRNPWFITMLVLLSVIALITLSTGIIRWLRRRDQQQLSVQRSLLHLEQMALQGQLNPHFIFNCIAAIKEHYEAGDKEKAHEFVDAFSLLIRQTFEMSAETFVSLDKELEYLRQYLIVEQQRFNHVFRFSVTRQTQLPDKDIIIPAMLLQPVVENAIRHGIRHLPDGMGFVTVTAEQQAENVRITITDNGIGREKSKMLSRHFNIRKLTSTAVNEKRLNILNRLFPGKINIHMEDLHPPDHGYSGTKVVITYPLTINQNSCHESNHC
ncbi:sensor histidine kinase [Chitinophaga solisilvae]|uniref:sensor histidine kinase n=1 Tax=Chitinophaga solisilvae TaxID=1233460 RepID=UPI00136C6C66|nr:histidine kinase [Chitinophaga solisilvae]